MKKKKQTKTEVQTNPGTTQRRSVDPRKVFHIGLRYKIGQHVYICHSVSHKEVVLRPIMIDIEHRAKEPVETKDESI